MKLSLATLSVLLSTAAVHGLPANPESAVADVISHVSGVVDEVTHSQGPDDNWDDKEKALAKLEESRKITTERLVVALGTQSKADLQVQTAAAKLEDAEERFRGLDEKLEQLEEDRKALEASVQATESDRIWARSVRVAALTGFNEAKKESKTAIDEVDQLRKAIAQIDEAVKHIGDPDED